MESDTLRRTKNKNGDSDSDSNKSNWHVNIDTPTIKKPYYATETLSYESTYDNDDEIYNNIDNLKSGGGGGGGSSSKQSNSYKSSSSKSNYVEPEYELPSKLVHSNFLRSLKIWVGFIVFIFTFAYIITLVSPFRHHHQRRVLKLEHAEVYIQQPTCANHLYNVQTMELNQCREAARIISGPAPWELAFYDTMHDIGLCTDNKCSLLGIDWFAHIWWSFMLIVGVIVVLLVLGVRVGLNTYNAKDYNAHYSFPHPMYAYGANMYPPINPFARLTQMPYTQTKKRV
jgi:hypothetical protein